MMPEDRKGGGQSSHNKGSSDLVLFPEIEPADEWKISIMAPEDEKHDEYRSSSRPPYQLKKQVIIPKVPLELRWNEENKGLFDPKVVSIGPYHHNAKPEYEKVEKLKSKTVDAFVAAGSSEFYKNKILEVVSDARRCYLPPSTDAFNDEAFAEMMFHDGCFVLQLIFTFNDEACLDLAEHLGYTAYNSLFMDIILLENQLPFLILQTLIDTKYLLTEDEGEDKYKWEESIETFINLMYTRKKRDHNYKQESRVLPFHLLQLIRKRFLMMRRRPQDSHDHDRPSQPPPPPPPRLPRRSLSKDSDEELAATLDRVYKHSFRSATELKAKGIHFKASNAFCLNDLSFTTSLYGHAQLRLPRVIVGRHTKPLFLNMMAYELAPPFDPQGKSLEVCGYIYFMNSLINGAEDVMELRSHNIIHNFLSNDEGVAKAFNSMANSAFPPMPGTIADATSDQIQRHYNNKCKTWMAQLLHDHFTTPWSVLALIAALSVLVMTAVQTYYRIRHP